MSLFDRRWQGPLSRQPWGSPDGCCGTGSSRTEVFWQSNPFPKGFLSGALTAAPHCTLLLPLVPLSPKCHLFLSQEHSRLCLVTALPAQLPAPASCCSRPGSLRHGSSAAAGKGDFILGIFQSADPAVSPKPLLYLLLAHTCSSHSLTGLVPSVT